MKTTIIRLLVIVVGLTTLFNCCKKDDDIPYETLNPILGKWEGKESGNWPNMHPIEANGFTEFFADSIVRFYEYSKKQYTNQAKYWIDDSIVYTSYLREDGFELIIKEKYEFSLKNQKLRLDLIEVFPIFSTSIYKRIK